jgi:hypothetical protein
MNDKKQAMSAVANVQALVTQAGLVTVTLGASVYAAHIRQMDAQRPQRPVRQRQIRRDAIGREA